MHHGACQNIQGADRLKCGSFKTKPETGTDVLFCLSCAGPENHCEADSSGAQHWQRALWGGVERKVARGECGCQDFLHHGRGQLVQGN